MNQNDLVLNLKKLGVHPSSYCLGAIKNGECVCVVKEGGVWKVLYVERDRPKELGAFGSEEEAYDFVYETFCRWLGVTPASTL
jgi:hypothetical protein